MKGTILYGPRDVRLRSGRADDRRPDDAIVRIAATCVCGSDLWPYRGISRFPEPTPMGHEYCGIVEEVGSAVKSVKPGQFVIGSFATPTTPALTAGTATSPPACTASSLPGRRRRCSACRWRTGRSCRRRACRRTT